MTQFSARILFFLLIPFSFSFAENIYPLTITDGMGQELVIAKKPQSISSLTLFTDELLMEMVPSQRIASMTFLANDPVFSNIKKPLPTGVQFLDFNVEAILNIYPDIVFAANWSEAGKVKQLINAGIPVYLINTPVSLQDIQFEIRKVAKILGEQDAGEAILQAMDAKILARKPQVESVKSKQLVSLDYNTWGTASGKETTWHHVLSQAGIINGVEKFQSGDYGQVTLSKEMIVEINPDILFLPGWIYGDPAGADKFRQDVLSDPALTSVKAIQENRIYLVPENLRGSFSHHFADTIALVLDLVLEQN